MHSREKEEGGGVSKYNYLLMFLGSLFMSKFRLRNTKWINILFLGNTKSKLIHVEMPKVNTWYWLQFLSQGHKEIWLKYFFESYLTEDKFNFEPDVRLSKLNFHYFIFLLLIGKVPVKD